MEKTKPCKTSQETKERQLDKFIVTLYMAHIAKDDQDKQKRTFTDVPLRYIQDRFGMHCAQAFRLLFTQVQRGGKNLKGVCFKTRWEVTPEYQDYLFECLEKTREGVFKTGKDWVAFLTSKGVVPMENAILRDVKGNKIGRKVVSKAEAKQIRSTWRELYFKHQDQLAELPDISEIDTTPIDIATAFAKGPEQ